MRLLTFIHDGQSRFGALVNEGVVDLSAAQETGMRDRAAPASLADLITAGPDVWARLSEALEVGAYSRFTLPLNDVKLAAPILPPKIVAIGLNYADHVREQGGTLPDHPIVFAKFPTSVIGPGDAIRWEPALSDSIDWEAELAVVIGRTARRVSAAAAYEHVFGYTIANDVTARNLQNADGQFVRGKSLDTFCPLGPWIVTRDEMPEPHGLAIRCRVNGEIMQDSSTDQLIFGVPTLIEFLSRAFTLLPGDIILTGTPPGVGTFRKPPLYLRSGDAVEVEIEGIGVLRNICRADT